MPAVYHFVTLVDGVPQCGCGTPIDDCCMYPWPNPESPIYPPEDLPSAIVETAGFYTSGSPETYTHNIGEYKFTAASGRYIEAELGTGLWSWYDSLGLLQKWSACLIGTWGVGSTPMVIEDQFSTTYSVTYLGVEPPEEYTVTRVSTCRWETADGLTWLEYVYNSETLDTKWNLHIQSASLEMSKVGDSTPAGDYDNGSETATVA